KPFRASVLKFSTVLGATSGQNSMTISPALVFSTATSFDAAFVSDLAAAAFLFVSSFESARALTKPRTRPKAQSALNSFIVREIFHEHQTKSRVDLGLRAVRTTSTSSPIETGNGTTWNSSLP